MFLSLTKKLVSDIDSSVNFILDTDIEARFVQRTEDYFIVYLSSQRGCDRTCRFCHLTQMGLTNKTNITLEEYYVQAKTVFAHYESLLKEEHKPAEKVHFNFMARGEPLLNSTLLYLPNSLFHQFMDLGKEHHLQVQNNVSTIIPRELDTQSSFFTHKLVGDVRLYYSMYSANPTFRKRWIPKAMEIQRALPLLKAWQELNESPIVFHHCFIKGENDSLEEVERFLDVIEPYHFKAKFNCVRFNSFDINQYQESDEDTIIRNFNLIANEMTEPGSRIVPRVGFDIKASCGTFVES